MKLLIDSSTNYLYLSLVNNNEIKYFVRSGKNDHSETLVDFLNKFLNENSITIDDITEVYVGRGPGSYTGLRIAGTVGKVLAHIKNKKFFSFFSFTHKKTPWKKLKITLNSIITFLFKLLYRPKIIGKEKIENRINEILDNEILKYEDNEFIKE